MTTPTEATPKKARAKGKAAPRAKASYAKAVTAQNKATKALDAKRAARKAAPVEEARSFAPVPTALVETKTEMLQGMMRRPEGATSAQMEKATGWAPHSVRGLLGTLRKRRINVQSDKQKGRPTVYRISPPVGDVI